MKNVAQLRSTATTLKSATGSSASSKSTIEVIPTFWHEAYRDATVQILRIRNAVR